MKSSLKVIVAALALATAGGAFAQTATSSATGSDTYFYAYDNTTATSFLLDLGSNYANFNGNTNETFANIGSNSAYQAFAGAVTDGLIEWGVFSAASTGSPAGVGLDVTNGATTALVGTKAKYLTTDEGDISTLMAGLYNNNISAASGVTETGPVAQNAQASVAANTNLAGVLAVNAIGTSASYISYNQGALTGTTLVSPKAFEGNWTFNGTNLAYTTTVAAVPEPTSIMMMLGGLLMLGALAVRRRNSK